RFVLKSKGPGGVCLVEFVSRARGGKLFAVRNMRSRHAGLPEFLLLGRAAAELNLSAPRLGMSLDTQQSTADCCVPGESERHAGREVGRTGWRRKPPAKQEKFGARWTACKALAAPRPKSGVFRYV